LTLPTKTTTTTTTTRTTTTTTTTTGYNYKEPSNPLRLPAKSAKSIDSQEESRNNRVVAPIVNKIETDQIDIRTIAEEEDEAEKGNAPIQTCLEMALEGLMTPLPGVNCIHNLKKVSTTRTATATTEKTTSTVNDNLLDVRNAFDKKSEPALVSYDVDLDEEEEEEEELQDESNGKLLEEEDYPIVGRDFDLATNY
jgi:hypothetical protein